MGRAITIAIMAVGAALFVAAIWWFDPVRTAFFPVCMFHQLTGLHCPGCGSSRALHALAHGEFAQAFSANPLFWVLLPVVIVGLANPAAISRVRPRWIWTLLGVIIVFGVVRNIPAYPFTVLAP